MLISLDRRFAFIHVSKTAGTSMQKALEPFATPLPLGILPRWGRRLGLDRAVPPHRRLYREHMTADQLRRRLGQDRYDSLFTLAFVRNPWDWMVSMYEYLRGETTHRHHPAVRRMTFAQYVDFEISRGRRSQSVFIVDRDGHVMVNFVGRFERLHADFARLCAALDVEARLPHLNRSRRADYRTYYEDDPALISRVGDFLREDVERFGYVFSDRPTVDRAPAMMRNPSSSVVSANPGLARVRSSIGSIVPGSGHSIPTL